MPDATSGLRLAVWRGAIDKHLGGRGTDGDPMGSDTDHEADGDSRGEKMLLGKMFAPMTHAGDVVSRASPYFHHLYLRRTAWGARLAQSLHEKAVWYPPSFACASCLLLLTMLGMVLSLIRLVHRLSIPHLPL